MQIIQDFLTNHWQVFAVIYGINIVGAAAQKVLQKIIDLTPEIEGADSFLTKAAAYSGKAAEYAQKLIDLVIGNPEHK